MNGGVLIDMIRVLTSLLLGVVLIVWPTVGFTKDIPNDLLAYSRVLEKIHSLPNGLLSSICYVESRFRSNQKGKHGEVGICQLRPETAEMVYPEIKRASRGKPFMLGDSNDMVSDIQSTLQAITPKLVVDSVFGGETVQAVRQFQKSAGLKEDGMVGPETWGRLFPGKPYPKGPSIEEQLMQPRFNMYCAAIYLRWLADNYSDHEGFLMSAYNSGPGSQISRYILKVLDARELVQAVNETK